MSEHMLSGNGLMGDCVNCRRLLVSDVRVLFAAGNERDGLSKAAISPLSDVWKQEILHRLTYENREAVFANREREREYARAVEEATAKEREEKTASRLERMGRVYLNDPSPVLEYYELRPDWKRFRDLLLRENIEYFFHITDRSNIHSIRQSNGLHSKSNMTRYGIRPTMFASSESSREIDAQKGMGDYVHLSFRADLPMMYIAAQEGRITDPVTLRIDARIVYASKTLFADRNATDNHARVGQNLYDLEKINFPVLMKSRWSSEEEKKICQAEVLVLTSIPLKFIKLA